MSDTLVSAAQAFYRQLASNNNRDWWTDNRATYDDVLKPAALAILEQLTPTLVEISGESVSTKLFRPHRDVRFSKDKTPYKTHLHMMWKIDAPARQTPVFFFGIGSDYVTAGAGITAFDKPVLEDWRKFVDLDTKRIMGIIADVQDHGFILRDPALKRVPASYPADHPANDLLRMKGCVATTDMSATTNLHHDITTAFRNAAPLNALLLQIAEA